MNKDFKEWKSLKDKILRNLKNGAKTPAPFLYLIFIIILSGGVGVWLPLIQGVGNIKANLMTYIFALISAILADFLLEDKKESQSYSMFVISITVLIIFLTVLSLNFGVTLIPENAVQGNTPDQPIWTYISIFLATVLLWLVWWILIPQSKFDFIEQKAIENSTIGNTTPAHDAKKRSLDALRNNMTSGEKHSE